MPTMPPTKALIITSSVNCFQLAFKPVVVCVVTSVKIGISWAVTFYEWYDDFGNGLVKGIGSKGSYHYEKGFEPYNVSQE